MMEAMFNLARTPKRANELAPRFFEPYEDVVALWCLRTMVRLWRRLPSSLEHLDDDLLEAVGLEEDEFESGPGGSVRKRLAAALEELEEKCPRPGNPLRRNLDMPGRVLGLAEVEKQLLAFAVLGETHRGIEEAVSKVGRIRDSSTLSRILPIILGQPGETLGAALSDNATLMASGLMSIESSAFGGGVSLKLLDGMADALLKAQCDPMAMFEQARGDGAVLLLDEADSFLRSRERARASWEATQVNELLVQMESFDGLFIASTNLMRALDGASLRRFDVKIRFDYLAPAQACTLFAQVLSDSIDARCGEPDEFTRRPDWRRSPILPRATSRWRCARQRCLAAAWRPPGSSRRWNASAPPRPTPPRRRKGDILILP